MKKSLVDFGATPIATSSGEPIHIHKLIDEIEQCVENGKMHFFGLVLIQPAPLLEKINLLETLLKHGEFSPSEDRTTSFNMAHEIIWVERSPNELEQSVESAKAEAERIIAEAKQEAETIIEQARRKAEQPWLAD